MLEAVFQNTALVKSIIDIHPLLYTEIYTEFRKKSDTFVFPYISHSF